ncbi:unnamed protein product [Angiostrongylus costaricensis]|uniref:Craniofacial development protein 2-like n=1 Tax=Angiostrongylus costaricensis TaxID=334426 RepID=A0A0R3PJ41_ANGCS|nr:unnamed protein product [Angiostrongylus costaricensis]
MPSDWLKREEATDSTPSMTPEKNCSSEHTTAEELAASVLSSTHRFIQATNNPNRTFTIKEMWINRCGFTIFVVSAQTSSYDEEEVEAFHMNMEKLYREDNTFFKVIIGDLNKDLIWKNV